MRRRTVLPLIAATVLAAVPAAGADAPRCLNDWSAARAIVKREGLTTVDQLMAQAPAKLGGDVVRLALCHDGETYTYRLTVREPTGALRQFIVDALKPFDP